MRTNWKEQIKELLESKGYKDLAFTKLPDFKAVDYVCPNGYRKSRGATNYQKLYIKLLEEM